MDEATKKKLRDGLNAVILQHLATHGPKNWGTLIERYCPHVLSEASFWRRVAQVKKRPTDAGTLQKAREQVIERMIGTVDVNDEAAAAAGLAHVAKHVPATPSPAYIARSGQQGLMNIDVMEEINKVYADAVMLRDYSVVERDGQEAIKNPLIFEKSIARRNDLIETVLRVVERVWDLKMMQSFYDAIIEEIGQEAPHVQRRIMLRLAELNSKHGFTIAGARI